MWWQRKWFLLSKKTNIQLKRVRRKADSFFSLSSDTQVIALNNFWIFFASTGRTTAAENVFRPGGEWMNVWVNGWMGVPSRKLSGGDQGGFYILQMSTNNCIIICRGRPVWRRRFFSPLNPESFREGIKGGFIFRNCQLFYYRSPPRRISWRTPSPKPPWL